MARVGLLFRISAGLVALVLSIVLMLDFFGLLQQATDQRIADRTRLAEVVATQISASPSVANLNAIRGVLQAARRNDPALLSAGLRGANGRLLISTPDHRELWQPRDPEKSTPDHLRVPIFQRGELWATLELRFEENTAGPITALLTSPLAHLLAALGAVCFVAFALYMMRTLRHLDPSAVIPPDVQNALNTMAEGVLFLDKQEEINLSNAAFATRIGRSTTSAIGVKMAALEWRLKDSDERPLELPWTQTIRGGVAVRGAALRLKGADERLATLVVNSSPVLDGWKKRVIGAIVTLDDVTELEHKSAELQRALVELEKSRDEVRLQNDELQILADTDPLTGVANRRSFYETADAAVRAARGARTPLCFVMCDIDHFKRINDEHGHSTGDEVIARLAQVLRSATGSARAVCRYGGEEFCALLEDYTAERAETFAEMVRRRIAGPGFARVPVTVSFGVVSIDSGTETAAQLIGQADEALYAAKRTGRNKVVLYGSPEFEAAAETVRE